MEMLFIMVRSIGVPPEYFDVIANAEVVYFNDVAGEDYVPDEPIFTPDTEFII